MYVFDTLTLVLHNSTFIVVPHSRAKDYHGKWIIETFTYWSTSIVQVTDTSNVKVTDTSNVNIPGTIIVHFIDTLTSELVRHFTLRLLYENDKRCTLIVPGSSLTRKPIVLWTSLFESSLCSLHHAKLFQLWCQWCCIGILCFLSHLTHTPSPLSPFPPVPPARWITVNLNFLLPPHCMWRAPAITFEDGTQEVFYRLPQKEGPTHLQTVLHHHPSCHPKKRSHRKLDDGKDCISLSTLDTIDAKPEGKNTTKTTLSLELLFSTFSPDSPYLMNTPTKPENILNPSFFNSPCT